MLTILDGPMGTELAARGIPTPPPSWSAAALDSAPSVVGAIHKEYAEASATVHTANTFRTKRRQVGARWEDLTRRAVATARGAIPESHRVAGSVAPLEDCYRPDLAPQDPRMEHRELCQVLASAGVDLILCETFPCIREALIAVEEAVATGLPVWASFTAGPDGELLSPADMATGAREAVRRGASAVLVNCTAASKTLPFVKQLSQVGVPFGAYANAGDPKDGVGWAEDADPEVYARFAASWVDAGATLIGGCCGTGPRHIAALGRLARSR